MSTAANVVDLTFDENDPPSQHRFWDETVRLLGLFERFRQADDNANAIACFSGLARYRFHELSSRPEYNPAKKSIVSVFQPKSGGTYLHNRLLKLGYQEFWWMYPHRLCHSVCFASDEALQFYRQGGCVCHTHARPDPNILAAFDRAGVEKIWVHLRNPAESVVSSYFHYQGEGHGEGEVGAQRKREALEEAERAGLARGMAKSTFVMEHVDWYVEWVSEWLSYARDRPGLVAFTYYSELGDPQAMLTRVFNELGGELLDDVSAAPSAQDRYRKKSTSDWRHNLSAAAQSYLEMRVRAELEEFPAFDRIWS